MAWAFLETIFPLPVAIKKSRVFSELIYFHCNLPAGRQGRG